MNKRGHWIYFVVILSLAASGSGCSKGGKGNPDKDRPTSATASGEGDGAKREYAVPVAIRSVVRTSMSEYVAAVGTIAPIRSVAVKAEESGRIRFVSPWREGQLVKEGDLLARLDAEETSHDVEMERANLETARSEVALSLARLERSVADFERAKKMFEMGQISRKFYEEREFNANSARIGYEESVIRVQRAEKSLQRLQLQMDRKNVRAPMSGYLVARDAIENSAGNPTAADSADSITDLDGRLVGTGSTICGIVDVSDVMIRCDVTSKDIAKIRKGQHAQAHVYSDEEITVEGEVTDVSPIMDTGTRAFEVDVTVPNREGRLRPGMFARVNIIIKTRRDTVVVNRKILQRRNNEDILFVVNEEERAEKRVAKVGLENPDEIEVVEGVRENEKLVILGYETLQDKVKVKVMETEPAVAEKDQATTSGSTTKQPGGRA